MEDMSKREFLKLCAFGGCFLARHGTAGFLERLEHTLLMNAAGEEPGKWSKEAMFWIPSSGAAICQKCPHGCVLSAGQMGLCRNRINYNGKLYSIAYGNPCAVHIDPVEKKPLFHFLPSTRAFSIAAAGCNLRCLNCQNWEISQVSPRETQNADMMPESVAAQAAENGCASIAYTYSEPTTFYEYAYDSSVQAHKRHIRNILKSSGYINEQPLRHLAKVLDAANIDLKGFDDTVYQKLNGAMLAPVLHTLTVLHEEKVWLEITNLVVPTWTDDLTVMRKMCEWLVSHGLQECPLHFTRFTPLYKLSELPMTPVATLEQARDIARKAGMQYVYIGNVPGHEGENTYCHKCSALLIERRGFAILKNDLKKGCCGTCGTKIPGIWS